VKRSTVFGHWEGTFIIVNSILLKYAFFFLNTFPGIAGSAGWMVAVYICIVFLVAVLIIQKLYQYAGQADLMDIAHATFGNAGKYILGFGLILCFLFNSGTNLIYFAESFKNSLLTDSSTKMMIIFLILVAFFLAMKGLDSIARVHAFFVPISLIATGIIAFFLMTEGSIQNIFPIFGTGLPNVFKLGHFALSGFFEFILITLITPYMKTYSEFSKTLKLTYVFVSAATLILSLVYIIAVPYPANTNILSVIMMTPDYMTFHHIPQELFTVFSIFYCICTALYISIHIYVCTLIFSKMFYINKTTPLTICFSVVLLGITQIPVDMNMNKDMYEIGLSFLWVVGLIVPIIVLACNNIKIKRLQKEDKHEKKEKR
jgi:spore germination protein